MSLGLLDGGRSPGYVAYRCTYNRVRLGKMGIGGNMSHMDSTYFCDN